MLSPKDFAVRSDGLIVIADSERGEISCYSQNGERVRTLINSSVIAIALGSQDQIYVLTRQLNPTLDVYTSEGGFLRQIPLDFEWALDLAVAPNGDLFVAAGVNIIYSSTIRIHRYDSFGNHVLAWDTTWGFDLAVNESGNIVIPQANYQRLDEYSPQGQLLKTIPLGFLPNTVLPMAGGYLVSQGGATYDLEPGVVTEISASGIKVATWGADDQGDPLLRSATKLEREFDGTILVLDSAFRTIHRYDAAGHHLSSWMDIPSPENRFFSIQAFSLRPSGNVSVLDASLFRVIEFDASGELLACRGIPGFGLGKFVAPLWDVAINASGETIVGDHKTLEVFSPNSRSITIPWSRSVACDEQDNIYVASGGILKLSPDGDVLAQWTEGFAEIYDLAFISNGSLIAADGGWEKVFVLNLDGTVLDSWDLERRLHVGTFSHIAIDAKNRIYVLYPDGKFIDIYSLEGQFLWTWNLWELPEISVPVDFAIDLSGQIWLADSSKRELFVYSALPDSLPAELP